MFPPITDSWPHVNLESQMLLNKYSYPSKNCINTCRQQCFMSLAHSMSQNANCTETIIQIVFRYDKKLHYQQILVQCKPPIPGKAVLKKSWNHLPKDFSLVKALQSVSWHDHSLRQQWSWNLLQSWNLLKSVKTYLGSCWLVLPLP